MVIVITSEPHVTRKTSRRLLFINTSNESDNKNFTIYKEVIAHMTKTRCALATTGLESEIYSYSTIYSRSGVQLYDFGINYDDDSMPAITTSVKKYHFCAKVRNTKN